MSERECDEACAVCRTVSGLRQLGAASVARRQAITEKQIRIRDLHRAIESIVNNYVGHRENPFRKNNDDLLHRALRWQCKIRQLEAEIKQLQNET